MLSIIRPRGDIKSNWENNNPILNFREWGVEWETTVGVGEIKIKIGDGITPWNNLEYALINNITKKIVGSFASVAGENPELTEGSSIDVLWAVTKKKFDYFKNKIDAINTMIGVFSNITINTGGNTHEAVSTITDAIKKLNSGKLTTADIYDGIDSTNLNLALSANRGRLLNEAINSLSGNLGTTLITQDLLEYANSLPAGFYSISTASGTPNAIGVSATGYILRRTGVDAIVALYGITSGTLNVNHYDGHTWLGWLKYTTNTDLGGAVFQPASGNIKYGMNGIYIGAFSNGPLQSDGTAFEACIYLIATKGWLTVAYVFPITQYSEGHLFFNRMNHNNAWELSSWKKLIA